MEKTTTYADAVSTIRNMVLCNDVAKLEDDVFFENVCEATFSEDDDDYVEVYQYYITDCNDYDVDYLRSRYDLRFAWCEKLGVWVLLVTHFGTMWSGVDWHDNESDSKEDNESDSKEDNESDSKEDSEESSEEDSND